MTTKQRSDGNTLAQVSMSKDLLEKSKLFARSREMPWATWVRSLILKELEAVNAGVPKFPNAPAGANAAESGGKSRPPPPARKCRGGKHCAIPKAVNS